MVEFVIGDAFSEPSANQLAIINPDGIGIKRLGPPRIGIYSMTLAPKNLSTQQIKNLLNHVLTLDEVDSRSPYDIGYFTNSSFYLGMRNSLAKPVLRQSVPFFTVSKFEAQLMPAINELFGELNKRNAHDNNDVVKRNVLKLFSQTLMGFELPEKLEKYLEKMPLYAFYFYLFPDFIKKIIPYFPTAFDLQLKLFLRAQINLLRKHETQSYPENLFQQIIMGKLPIGKKFSDISDIDREKLIRDPGVRLSVTGLLAVHNLQKVICSGLSYLYRSDWNFRLKAEVELIEDLVNSDLLDKNKFPVLHAFYLETLRVCPPMNLFRYTSKALTIEGIEIPARTIIEINLFSLQLRYFGTDDYPSECFYPERFLDGNKLNEQANLYDGLIISFGLGMRRCPAVKISEMIFKRYMVEFAKSLKFYNSMNYPEFYEFKPPPIKPPARHDILGMFAEKTLRSEAKEVCQLEQSGSLILG